MTDSHNRKRNVLIGVILGIVLVGLLVGALLVGPPGDREPIGDVMRNEVLHETTRIPFLGMTVNPGLIAAFAVTGLLTVLALILRLFVVPRFSDRPGTCQLLLEQAVGLFDGMARSASPHRNRFLGAYVFTAGSYIALGTLFELFGFQAVTVAGRSVTLPAPLSDINGAIAMGVLSYGVILIGGLVANGFRGMGKALKDFSLPISMSFRLFGALLSGALVTELVYSYTSLSFVLPVIVGVLFTLLHAIIQTYVLVMLTTTFYGESTEPSPKKHKTERIDEV